MATKISKRIPANFRTITCAFCKGKGKDPFEIPSKLSACQICIGRGEVRVIEPAEPCPYCKGKGIFFRHCLPCAVCGGKGMVTKIKGEQRCVKCKGDGEDPETGLPCSSCYALGSLSSADSSK